MKIKRKLCIALALMTVCCAGLVSCSNDDTDKNSSAANAAADVTIDVNAIADRLKNEIEYKDTLNELSADMIQKLFGLAANTDYKAGKVYVGSGGATAEEIACFEANGSENAAKIKTALEKRIESQKTAFENYQPQEMDKLNSPVLICKGNYVMMCISDDNSKAQEIIG